MNGARWRLGRCGCQVPSSCSYQMHIRVNSNISGLISDFLFFSFLDDEGFLLASRRPLKLFRSPADLRKFLDVRPAGKLGLGWMTHTRFLFHCFSCGSIRASCSFMSAFIRLHSSPQRGDSALCDAHNSAATLIPMQIAPPLGGIGASERPKYLVY